MPKDKGFTLVELLVVIAIIAILSVIGIVVFTNVTKSARDSKRIADLKAIAKSLEIFYISYGYYPRSDGDPSWDGHWEDFKVCLETGQNNNGDDCTEKPSIPGYISPMNDVPRDPQDTPGKNASESTYVYGYGSGCPESFRLSARLETDNPVLSASLKNDGGFSTRYGCASARVFCIGPELGSGSC